MVDALFERLVGPGEVIIRWAWPALSSAASRLTVKHAAGWVVCHCAPAAATGTPAAAGCVRGPGPPPHPAIDPSVPVPYLPAPACLPREGEAGDNFYLIESGTFLATVGGEEKFTYDGSGGWVCGRRVGGQVSG